MAKDVDESPDYEEYDVYDISLDELEDMPYRRAITNDTTQYNTGYEDTATNIIEDAARRGEWVMISGHDEASGLMVPFLTDEGQGYGLRASYILNDIGGSDLSDYLRDRSPIGELGEIDWYQIDVHHEG